MVPPGLPGLAGGLGAPGALLGGLPGGLLGRGVIVEPGISGPNGPLGSIVDLSGGFAGRVFAMSAVVFDVGHPTGKGLPLTEGVIPVSDGGTICLAGFAWGFGVGVT